MNRNSRNRWKLILIPFSWLYGLAVWIRNSLYDNGLVSVTGFNIPIISVGNITVGGTGKTPHVEYLVEHLKKEYRVATLSRGYRRKTRDFRIASADSCTPEIGDEPVQMKKKFPDVVVAVDRDRINGVRELMKLDPPVEAIILDDAFQHRSVRPGFSILLIDYNRPMVSDHLLPAGLLREPATNRHRANLILVTKSPPGIKPIEMREYVNRLGLQLGQHLFFTTMQYGELVPVFNDVPPRDLQYFKEQAGGVLVVSGIANPVSLLEYAREISINVGEIRFPDHHWYSKKDVNRILGKVEDMAASHQEILVLTTEKDAAKLRELDLPQPVRELMHSVRIRVRFLNEDKENFDKQIIRYVTSNKRSSILYQGAD